MRYTISEMAALLGVTTHTLRYWVLPPTRCATTRKWALSSPK